MTPATRAGPRTREPMSDWLHNLPILAMAAVIFGATYLAAFGIYVLVAVLARGPWGSSLKAVSRHVAPSGHYFRTVRGIHGCAGLGRHGPRCGRGQPGGQRAQGGRGLCCKLSR